MIYFKLKFKIKFFSINRRKKNNQSQLIINNNNNEEENMRKYGNKT